MYYILYSDDNGVPMWELVDGEDAMNIRVDELCRQYGPESDQDISVFDSDDELDCMFGGELI